MSKPKTSLWGYSFITSLVFNPPFPMSVLFLKRPEVLEKFPTCFDIYSVTSKQEDIFYKFSKNVLTLHLYAIIFFTFDPFPPWKMRTSYMESPCSRTYCSYSQIDVQMSPFIDSTTSLVTIVICNVITILHFLLFWSFDLFATYVLKKVPLSHRVNKNTYDVLPN